MYGRFLYFCLLFLFALPAYGTRSRRCVPEVTRESVNTRKLAMRSLLEANASQVVERYHQFLSSLPASLEDDLDYVARKSRLRLLHHLIENQGIASEPEMTATEPSLLREIKTLRSGSRCSFYDHPQFKTRIYHPVHPRTRRGYPEIGDTTKGIVLYFGGSGTQTSTGASIYQNASRMLRYGIDVISFDYPFHGQGPQTYDFFERGRFIRWVTEIVKHYKRIGIPVVLAGHSFGPQVIEEILRYSPTVADAALLFGIVGTTPPLQRQYVDFISSEAATNIFESQSLETNA